MGQFPWDEVFEYEGGSTAEDPFMGTGWCCLAMVAIPVAVVVMFFGLGAIVVIWDASWVGKVTVILGFLAVATLIWGYVTDR